MSYNMYQRFSVVCSFLLEGLFEEQGLAIQRFLALFRAKAGVVAVPVHLPGVRSVGELEVEKAADLLPVVGFAQGEELLDAPVEVALHQVGRTEVDPFVLALPEGVDPRVLQKTSHQRDHADALADPFEARFEAANPPDHQLYLHPGLRGQVEFFNDLRVRKGVHLAGDASGLPPFSPLRLPAHQLDEPLTHSQGGDEQFLVLLLLGVASQVVKEIRAILNQSRVVGKVGEVRVEPGGRRVVVAGAEVDVASQATSLAADDEADLGVRLQANDAVGHVYALGLQPARPGDIGLLVEACLQLHEHGNLRLLVTRLRERLDYRGVRPDAIEGLLYRQDVRIGGGGADELDHRGEGIVGVVEQDISLPDRRGNRTSAPDLVRDTRRDRRVQQVPPVQVRKLFEVTQAQGLRHRLD